MTGAERSWASHYEIDDVVRYTRGSKAIGIEAAAYATVVAINPAANQLTVEKTNETWKNPSWPSALTSTVTTKVRSRSSGPPELATSWKK
jgi:hypothetical protein